MILYKNVCDNCGDEERLSEDSTAFALRFTTLNAFGQVAQYKSHTRDFTEVTFCSNTCASNWFKENLENNGDIKDRENAF